MRSRKNWPKCLLKSFDNLLQDKHMILDNENQRAILLNIINTTQFHGSVVDEVYSIKQAIVKAEVKECSQEA